MALGGNVKGITIEFDGDTTKLGRALTSINNEAKGVDKSLKDVDRALKFNPNNTELLAQKQTLLKQKIGQTKKQLEALKQTQARLDDDPAVDKQSQEYMELRREIIKTESRLKHFQAEAEKLNNVKIDQLSNKLKTVGDKMTKVGQGLTKGVTAPIGAVGVASIAAFKEVDDGLDIIATKTGASGTALKNMETSAKNLATSIPTSFEDAGTAIGEVNTRFGLTGKTLEKTSGQFLKFAKINGVDVNTAIDTVQKAMNAYGLDATKTSGYLDVLNKVGQNTGISMDALATSLTTNAPALQAMGLNSTQAAFFVGELEKSGVDSTKALAGLQKALVNGAKEGKSMDDVLADVDSRIVNASSDTEAMSAASEIFGAKAGPAMATALRNGSLNLDALKNSADNAKGSVTSTFETAQDPLDKFQTTLNQAKIAGADVGTTLLTMLVPILEKLSTFLQKLSTGWNNLSPGMQNFIIKIAGIAAAVGPALIVIGKMVSTVGTLIGFVPKIIKGIGMITKVMMANPWMLIIMGIVAAIILIATHWEQVKAVLIKVWNAIKKVALTVWNAIKASIVGPIQIALTVVKKVASAIKSVFNFTALKNAVSKVFNGIKNAITHPIQTAKDIIQGIIDKIKGFFNFKVSLPHIKLPHFSISPKGWKIGDLLKGKIPKLGIEWYAQGGIFNGPSVIGVGEAGSEAVVPLDKLWEKMDSYAQPGGDNININVYGSPGMDVNELAAAVERRLIESQKRRRLVWQ